MASGHITAIRNLDATVLEVMRQTPPVGGFFRRSKQAIELADVAVPENSVIQVALTPTTATGGTDLSEFRRSAISMAPLSKPCCPLAAASGCASAKRWLNWRSG